MSTGKRGEFCQKWTSGMCFVSVSLQSRSFKSPDFRKRKRILLRMGNNWPVPSPHRATGIRCVPAQSKMRRFNRSIVTLFLVTGRRQITGQCFWSTIGRVRWFADLICPANRTECHTRTEARAKYSWSFPGVFFFTGCPSQSLPSRSSTEFEL